MRFGSWIAVAGVAAMMGAGVAQAAPLSTAGAPNAMLQTAVDTGPAPQIELVRNGCGFGEHRGFFRGGRCHYNRGFRGHIRARHNYIRRHYY